MAGVKRRVRIADQGQIALPANFLRKHRLKAGDEVALEETDQGVVITREEPMYTEHESLLFAKPSPTEIARRQVLFAQVMAHRQARDIRPLTSTDLVHLARTEEGSTDDPGA
ncbi:MAG TPA: AbrB/MazE/SpoVT family DNA-binding domain-containing protein [Ktedonobacterales bacterium]|nr:AbrB/MazE/SpoVT family DNA-binding domain-containing protein [Ktedonobacterales bacterium]